MKPEERFWAKVNLNGGYADFADPLVRVSLEDGECWIWTAGHGSGRYGAFWLNGRTLNAHRARLILDGTFIPVDHEPDHLCRRVLCVRHLEVVPRSVNVLRSDNPLAQNARKTHCSKGHEFTPENTRPASGGRAGRRCRECARAENRAYHRSGNRVRDRRSK